jgi:hypothetical protein
MTQRNLCGRTLGPVTDGSNGVAYRAPSALVGERDLRLSTWAPDEARPALFFDGYVTPGEQTARALLLIGKVARTRFYTPPGMLARILRQADPVVTSNDDRLRFESFSACSGVAARLDVLPDGMDPAPLSPGTTNVDINPPLRAALTDVRGLDPLHLAVGTDVTVTTLSTQVIEPKVPLPARWVRSFAESQAVAATLSPHARLTPAAARSFIRSLPASSGSKSVLYAAQHRDGLRLTTRAGRDTIPVGGPSRLRLIEPMLRFARGLTVYSPTDQSAPAASLWQLDLEHARLSVLLSPLAMRGFSGEGSLLRDLASDRAAEDAEVVSALLAHEPVVDVELLAHSAGIAQARVERALTHLAASGRVGWDAAERAWFHRELPWLPQRLEKDNPRLAGARTLVADGAVRIDGDRAVVTGTSGPHLVRLTERGLACTCAWFAQHGTSRGPCKHALAVEISLGSTEALA